MAEEDGVHFNVFSTEAQKSVMLKEPMQKRRNNVRGGGHHVGESYSRSV